MTETTSRACFVNPDRVCPDNLASCVLSCAHTRRDELAKNVQRQVQLPAPWRSNDDQFNILATNYDIAKIFNGKLCDLLTRWLEIDGDSDDVAALIHDTREAVKSRHE